MADAVLPRTRLNVTPTQGLMVRTDSDERLSLTLPRGIVTGKRVVSICDVLGRRVLKTIVDFSANGDGVPTLLVGNLPSGSYVITVQLPKGAISARYVKIR